MLVVKITERNFSFGRMIFGKGGEYQVDEKTARFIVKNGKGIVIEGTLPVEEEQSLRDISDAQFLVVVKRNALQIAKIISEAFETDRIANIDAKMAVDNSEIPITDAKTASSNELEIPDTMNVSIEGSDESESSVGDGSLPEDFPGRDILLKNNINFISEIPADKAVLMELQGMTSRLANQIGVKLNQG